MMYTVLCYAMLPPYQYHLCSRVQALLIASVTHSLHTYDDIAYFDQQNS